MTSTTGLSATHNAGIYYNVSLFDGSGTGGAKATIVTSETAVTTIKITAPSSGFAVGDILTIIGSDIGRSADLTFTLISNDISSYGNMNTILNIDKKIGFH